jgi:protein-S-isoprenylcysteine O-methyltransferase Ste14
MRLYKTIGLIIYFSFYINFYITMFLQYRRGIKTVQVGRGRKPRKTFIVEILLVVMLLLTSFIQFISIVLVEKLPILIQNDWVRSCGAAISIMGIIAFIAALATLRDNWRGGIDYNQKTKLITTGIYKYSRNPGFVGFDLFFTGISLLFSNFFNILFSCVLILIIHLQILEEEKFLSIAFGKEYLDYKNKTRRYLGIK